MDCGRRLSAASSGWNHLLADYFAIDYEDQIAAGGPAGDTSAILQFENQWREIILRNQSLGQLDAVCSRSDFIGDCTIPPVAIVDFRLRNLANVRTSGVDMDVQHSTDTPLGRLRVGLSTQYVFHYERAVSTASPSFDLVDTVGNVPHLRLRSQLTWSRDAWDASGFVNYLGSYEDPSNDRNVGSWTTVDLHLGYRIDVEGWLSGTSVALDIRNVFDEAPPFVNRFDGYDASNASLLGRTIGAQVTKSW